MGLHQCVFWKNEWNLFEEEGNAKYTIKVSLYILITSFADIVKFNFYNDRMGKITSID